MIIHDVVQNSPEWYQARLGVITASTFGKIITPKTMKLSKQAAEIEDKIVAELLTGESCDEFNGNGWTERGHELEPEAVSLYEMLNDCECVSVGFITNAEGSVGCSPDRLVGEDGGLEIKCLSGHRHVKFALAGNLDEEHGPQIQGQMMLTNRKWWDVMSYHPKLPPKIIRVERDEAYIQKLSEAITEMQKNIQFKIKTIKGEKK